MVEFDLANFNFIFKMRTAPIGTCGIGVFTVECCKSGKSTALDLHSKCCIAGRNFKFRTTVILHDASGGNHQVCGRIVNPEPFDNAQGSVLSDIERLSKPQHLYWGVEGLTSSFRID